MKYTFIIVVKMFVCSATCVILVAYARIYIYTIQLQELYLQYQRVGMTLAQSAYRTSV
jgi:hypothetical protein